MMKQFNCHYVDTNKSIRVFSCYASNKLDARLTLEYCVGKDERLAIGIITEVDDFDW